MTGDACRRHSSYLRRGGNVFAFGATYIDVGSSHHRASAAAIGLGPKGMADGCSPFKWYAGWV